MGAEDLTRRYIQPYRCISVSADLRERYGARPKWLEVGGLAQAAHDGLVVVWSIGRGVAEVQPLTGGEAHWVKITELSPPRAT